MAIYLYTEWHEEDIKAPTFPVSETMKYSFCHQSTEKVYILHRPLQRAGGGAWSFWYILYRGTAFIVFTGYFVRLTKKTQGIIFKIISHKRILFVKGFRTIVELDRMQPNEGNIEEYHDFQI